MRWVWVLVALVLLVAMQQAWAARLAIGGAPPDLVLAGVLIWAFWQGPLPGLLAGVASGILLDAAAGAHPGLFALAGGLAGWVSGEVGLRLDLDNGGMRWLAAFLAAVLYGLVVVAGARWLLGLAVDLRAVGRHVLLSAGYDGLLVAVGYWPVARLTHNPLPLGTKPLTLPWGALSRRRRRGRAEAARR